MTTSIPSRQEQNRRTKRKYTKHDYIKDLEKKINHLEAYLYGIIKGNKILSKTHFL